MSLKHAIKWSFLTVLATKAITPIVFVVLARLLTPEDFGVMTSALMVIGFSQLFWEAGMGKALIQRQEQTDQAANVAFWSNIALSIVIGMALFFASPKIADTFFHDSRVSLVLKVMTLQIFLGAVSSVHTALLQKEMGFKKMFWVRFATVGFPGLASIPLAFSGMGYWALVAGNLVGQVAQVVMLWRMSHWRPTLNYSIPVAKEMTSFGLWVALTGLFAWVFQWLDTLLLGMFFGMQQVGLFRVGNQFANALFALLFSSLMPVLFSHFSSFAGDKTKIKTALFKAFTIIPIISLPISMGAFFFSPFVERYVFGNKWNGVGYVFGLIALKESVLWIFAHNMEAVRAMGKPKLETFGSLLSALSNVGVLYYYSQFGFNEFVFGRSIVLMLFGLAIHFCILLYVFPRFERIYARIFMYLAIWGALLYVIHCIYHENSMGVMEIAVKATTIVIFTFLLIWINRTQIQLLLKKGNIKQRLM